MLIIPVFNKNDAKIPFICIALILINSFIYFFIQSGDTTIRQQAYEYYSSSGLVTLELRSYRDYLIDKGDVIPKDILGNDKSRYKLQAKMFADREFQKQLSKNQIIQPVHSDYREWREKRDHFENIEHQTIIYQYGYSPDRNNLIGLVTSMFLHGGIMHLVGNMVFLWFVGALLEKAMGTTLFFVLYVITGIFATGLFGLSYPSSPGPLVGASGAIAGLMGGYGVIFGLRKIRVFWSLGFYFNYANVPAITLFPVWLLNELFQLFLYQNSPVAYMAHIGGLLSGIVIGSGYRYFLKSKIESLFHREEQKSELELLLSNGLDKVIELNMQGARNDFCKVLDIDPNNRSALKQIFSIDKTSPESQQFHQSAKRLLQNTTRDNHDDYLEIFNEYKATSNKPRVTVEILERLTHCYLKSQDVQNASSCLSKMIKHSPTNDKIPGFLMTLAHGYNQIKEMEKVKQCYKILATRYTETPEGAEAEKRLIHSQQ